MDTRGERTVSSTGGDHGEMVYIGKNGGVPPEREMIIPNRYSGNAFDADGTRRDYNASMGAAVNTNADTEAEARRHAEELFRRGYVFDDEALQNGTGTASRADGAAEAVARAVGTSAKGRAARPEKRRAEASGLSGILGGIFDRITTEDILLGALILMLYMNGADDELLIMLAILLFC